MKAYDHLLSRMRFARTFYKAPAILAAVVRKNGAYAIAALDGVRKADLAESAPGNLVQDNDVFPTGSCSKPLTGYMLANYLKVTQFTWQTTIGDVFPELTNAACRKLYNIRDDFLRAPIRDMMSHTARFPYSPSHGTNTVLSGMHMNFDAEQVEEYSSRRAETQRRFNFMIAAQQDAPGPVGVYNGGPILPIAMVERITGKSYQALMKEYLFDPLEMPRARIGPATTDASTPDGPWSHQFDFTGLKFVPDHYSVSKARRYEAHNPAGAVNLSAADAVKFIEAHFVNSTKHWPLHGPLLEETFGVYRNGFSVSGWGTSTPTGPGAAKAPDMSIGHDGDDHSCYARFVIWPYRGEGYFIATNAGGAGTLDGKEVNVGEKIVNIVGNAINDMLPRWDTDFQG